MRVKKLAFIFGISFAGIAAILTIAIVVLGSMDLGLDKYGATSNFLFGVWMLLAVPAITFMRAVGIPEGHWWAYLIGVAINTILGFSVGALIGVIVSIIKKCVKTNEPNAS